MSDTADTSLMGAMPDLSQYNFFGIANVTSVDLTQAVGDDAPGPLQQWQVTCFLNNQRDGDNDNLLGARISAIFVLLVTSTLATMFPVIAVRAKKVKIPLYVYLFARYFGAGVIIATAFIHLLDPGYSRIGPASCVGLMDGWSSYSWPPAISMFAGFVVFLLDFAAERYVDRRFGLSHGETGGGNAVDQALAHYSLTNHQPLHSGEQDGTLPGATTNGKEHVESEVTSVTSTMEERSFQKQIAAFLVLEFGVIFHSVIIGLTLGSAADEFKTLYPVIVFHQTFEGLGIGARMSSIPFPAKLKWMPWALCVAYGLTTPIAVAIGLGIRTTYDANSITASIVSGVLDSFSSGILLYAGWVSLIGRDFIWNPAVSRMPDRQVAFMVFCVILGAGIMALLGKWA